jgi:Flp pilus assembly pilin Flp
VLTRTRSDRGASAVEYGMLVAGVAGALLLGTAALQSGLASAYDSTASSIEATPPSPPPPAQAQPSTPASTPRPASTPTPTPVASTTAPVPEASTTAPAPTSTPTPTSVPVTTPTLAPTPTATADYRVRQDDAVTMDVLASGTSKTGTPTVSPASAGKVAWSGTRLVFEADDDARPGQVTVVFQYKKGSTVYTDTITVLIERD